MAKRASLVGFIMAIAFPPLVMISSSCWYSSRADVNIYNIPTGTNVSDMSGMVHSKETFQQPSTENSTGSWRSPNGHLHLIDTGLDCDVIESYAGSLQLWKQNMVANWAALLHLCNSTLRGQMQAHPAPSFKERFVVMSSNTGVVSEAYVSFVSGSKHHIDLAKWAFLAATEFSTKPIILFVSGEAALHAAAMFPASQYPRLAVFEMPPPVLHPWFDKLRAALLSPVAQGVFIESDTLITRNADMLFGVARKHSQKFPLLTMHPDVREPNCAIYNGPRTCSNPLPYPAEKRTVPYGHAHMIWSASSKPFLSRALIRCLGPAEMCDSDEAALNFQLWEEKATKVLCTMDPYYTFIDSWEELKMGAERMIQDTSDRVVKKERAGVAVLFLHGNKNPKVSKKIFNRIGTLDNLRPWIALDGMWLNGTSENLAVLERHDGCVLSGD